MAHAVQHHAGTHFEWHRECQLLQVFAIGAHAGIDGHHQHGDLGLAQTRDQLADAIDIARQIGLIPAALAGRLLQPLQRHAGGAADDERNLGILRSARQRQIALVHDDGGEPRRREADRHGIGLAEKLDLAAALIHHAQAAGPETDVAQCPDALVKRCAVFRAAADVTFDAARQDAARLTFEVAHRQAAVQAAHAATGVPVCRPSACRQAARERSCVSW
ncbi:hypothetical protein G6F31_016678 [Rhizopus arrhizus]|nr:hypothetical protein G6F31_016678 [Rhizopus arrhizus]